MHVGSTPDFFFSQAWKVHQAMKVAWWSLGTFSEGMGLKEAEGVISSNHNKGRALGPSRLAWGGGEGGGAGGGEWKRATVWKIKSLSLYLSTQTLSLIPAVCLLFIYEWHWNMDSRSRWMQESGGPNQAPQMLKTFQLIFMS